MAADRDPATRVPPARRAGSPGARDRNDSYRICVVCLGNICRSPMAEVILRDELGRAGLAGQVTVESAGTGDWHIGGPMDPRARAELGRRGYDGSAHIARQIQPDWLAGYDLFVVMDRMNLADLRRLAARDPELANGRITLMRSFDPVAEAEAEVPDPYHGGPAEYEETFELVHAAARGLTGRLAELLTERNGPVGVGQPAGDETGPRQP
ncbi:MAG TPA: low molecular weight protein-tyrosine-phosphatase [Streptosporangiaceae bacterium]|nr:low molecular weight protein-tyrosine-phosphatase [Streptosporangiaceae bacterium]